MKELDIEAKNENLESVLAFVDEELEKSGCSMKAQMQIDVVLEEIFVNISSYAYGDETGDVKILTEIAGEPSVLTVIFKDSGMPFDPLVMEEPDISLPAEKRDIGGLGIYLVKKMMDEVDYKYEDGKNILTIKKVL